MEGTDGPQEAGRNRESGRFAAELVLVAVVCVLAGFVVGIARSHGGHASHSVTVRTTVSVSGGP